MRTRRTGFTLLEVILALGILSASLLVLVESKASAVDMTILADRLTVATELSKEKLSEVRLMLEREGFGDQELEEEGDFDQYGDDLDDVDFGEKYDDFQWAYTVREIELDLGADVTGAMGDMASSGYWGEAGQEADISAADTPNLGDMGVSADMVTDMLSPYIREIRIRVWWGDNEEGEDQVEITTHVINPSGTIVPGAGATGLSGEGNAATPGEET